MEQAISFRNEARSKSSLVCPVDFNAARAAAARYDDRRPERANDIE